MISLLPLSARFCLGSCKCGRNGRAPWLHGGTRKINRQKPGCDLMGHPVHHMESRLVCVPRSRPREEVVFADRSVGLVLEVADGLLHHVRPPLLRRGPRDGRSRSLSPRGLGGGRRGPVGGLFGRIVCKAGGGGGGVGRGIRREICNCISQNGRVTVRSIRPLSPPAPPSSVPGSSTMHCSWRDGGSAEEVSPKLCPTSQSRLRER